MRATPRRAMGRRGRQPGDRVSAQTSALNQPKRALSTRSSHLPQPLLFLSHSISHPLRFLSLTSVPCSFLPVFLFADFNLSKLMEENSVMSSMAATNPRWLAPEILAGANASYASDVYAFG